MNESTRMKPSPMHDALMAAWAMALTLGYEDPTEVFLYPGGPGPEFDSDLWTASFADHDSPIGEGETPEAALGSLISQTKPLLEAKKKTLEEALSYFDEACEWDSLRLNMNKRPHVEESSVSRNFQEVLDKISTSEEVTIPSTDMKAMIAALEWYALLEGNVSVRANLTLGLIRGQLFIVKCRHCGEDLVQLPLRGSAVAPVEDPICPQCSGEESPL